MLPVLVCDKAAGAAIRTKAKPRNSNRPSCSNDVRLMNPSPVRVFASLITRPLGFVKVGDSRIDWERRFHFLFLKRISMRSHSGFLTALPTALALIAAGPASAQRPAAAPKIDSLLARMTLEEKLGQLNQLSVDNQPNAEQLELVRKGLVGSFFNLTGAAATRQAQHISVTDSRLHIPLIFGHDVIHGYRTIFPIPLGEAASWDPEAVQAAAHVAAAEAAAAGLHWTFAPMVDIARDPRWGRIAEGSGEDPYLGSAMAAARVRGFQGTDPRAADAVLATVKHFAAYGGAGGGRDNNTLDLAERPPREQELPPYRAALCPSS